MPKKITLENTLPGDFGDCVTVLADGEPVATVRPVDEGMWLWTELYTDEESREVPTEELRVLVAKFREDAPAVQYLVHECTDGQRLGPDGAVVGYDSRDHTGTCGCWTTRGPYETEERAMQWRSGRHVVILRDEGGKQTEIAEYIGGIESDRSQCARTQARVSAELCVPVDEYTGDWRQLVVRLPPGESGSTRYVTWERSSHVAKYYTPEGLILAKWTVPASASYADCFALVLKNTNHETPAGFSVQFQTWIYGSED